MRILVTDTRKRLMSIWFTGSGLVFALLLVQTILGKYGDQARDAWGVILPTFVPTLFLLIGILIAEAVGNANDFDVIVTSDRFFFRLADFLSITYLTTVLLLILLSPFSRLSQLELLKLSSLWLTPFQGLVSAALGAFFVSGNRQADK